MVENKKKVLVIRLSSLGDVVLSTVVLGNIREKYADAYIAVLVKEEFMDIFKANPYLDEIIVFSKKDSLTDKIKQIRRQKFNLVIDLHHNLRSHIITFFSGANKKIRYKKDIFARRYLVYRKKLKHPIKHTVERYLEAISRVNIKIKYKNPQIFLTEEDIKQAKIRIKSVRSNLPQVLIGVNLGAKHKTKKMFSSKYTELIQKLLEKNYTPVLLGGKEDLEFTKKIISGFGPYTLHEIFNLVGKTDLRGLIALIKMCKVLITPDTGAMHIAAALEIPVVALFGPTTLDFGFGPWEKNKIIIQKDLPCRPCSLHAKDKCPKKTFDCLNLISTEEIINAVDKLLKNG
ncbi:glycosyltransferase family 9 protein [bacterium]|nr:glycosyltransferase family 9 protein [bacterium]